MKLTRLCSHAPVAALLPARVGQACFGAVLLKTEMDIRYTSKSSIVDYSCKVFGLSTGVSVTRVSWAKREITLIARGMKLTRLCSHAHVAALLPARVGQAMSWPPGTPFDPQEAVRIMKKKLIGLQRASEAVDPRDKWSRCLLHVWAQSTEVKDELVRAYNALPLTTRRGSLVLVSVAQAERRSNDTVIFFASFQQSER